MPLSQRTQRKIFAFSAALRQSKIIMTVTIELKPEIEKRLAERARQKNLRIETFLEVFIEENLDEEIEVPAKDEEKPIQKTSANEEWSAKFRRWLDSRADKGKPFLSDEATRRENIYEDRF